MSRLLAALTCTAALTLATAATAPAQQTIAPPGNSGVDQYLEVVPSAKGNATPTSKGKGKGDALPDRARRELQRAGRAGRELERLVDATAPPAVRQRSAAERGFTPRRGAGAPTAETAAPESDGPLRSVVDGLVQSPDDGGMGIGLPLLLLATTGALAALAVRRRRSA